jgi:hypothetical protein
MEMDWSSIMSSGPPVAGKKNKYDMPFIALSATYALKKARTTVFVWPVIPLHNLKGLNGRGILLGDNRASDNLGSKNSSKQDLW